VGDEHVPVLREQPEHSFGVDEVLGAAEADEGEGPFYVGSIAHKIVRRKEEGSDVMTSILGSRTTYCHNPRTSASRYVRPVCRTRRSALPLDEEGRGPKTSRSDPPPPDPPDTALDRPFSARSPGLRSAGQSYQARAYRLGPSRPPATAEPLSHALRPLY